MHNYNLNFLRYQIAEADQTSRHRLHLKFLAGKPEVTSPAREAAEDHSPVDKTRGGVETTEEEATTIATNLLEETAIRLEVTTRQETTISLESTPKEEAIHSN